MLSLPVFPAPWIAPSPPTAAIEPEAAREMLARDVMVPEAAAFGLANTFADSRGAEREVRNPPRIRDARSELENSCMGSVSPVG